MELYIDILSKTEETVSSEQHGTREHVTFNIIAKQILDKINDPPPTFIAQTKKHGEEQILQKVLVILPVEMNWSRNLFHIIGKRHAEKGNACNIAIGIQLYEQ